MKSFKFSYFVKFTGCLFIVISIVYFLLIKPVTIFDPFVGISLIILGVLQFFYKDEQVFQPSKKLETINWISFLLILVFGVFGIILKKLEVFLLLCIFSAIVNDLTKGHISFKKKKN